MTVGVRRRAIAGRRGRPRDPGPGPTPEALLRALDLTVGRRIRGLLPGEYRAHDLGGGTELAQVRPYEPGDDVRRMDWNVTARTTVPHVRVHVPERALTAWLLLDVSPSMTFGTADRRKADVAEGVAVAIGHLADAAREPARDRDVRRIARPAAAAGGRPDRAARAAARDAGSRRSRTGSAPRRRPTPCGSPTRPRRVAASSSSCPTSAARATGARPLAALAARHHVARGRDRRPARGRRSPTSAS